MSKVLDARIKSISLAKIAPPHGVEKDCDELKYLIKKMSKCGWKGRPLLILDYHRKGLKRRQSLTGSHRHRAAREIGLKKIPCIILTKKETETVINAWKDSWRSFYPSDLKDVFKRNNMKELADFVYLDQTKCINSCSCY